MENDPFRNSLLPYFDAFQTRVMDNAGNWAIKGFIDIYQRIYTITLDTKVLSKVLELLLFPVLMQFAEEQGYTLLLAEAQNQYPDISLISKHNETLCFAVDVKSTYRASADAQGQQRVSGMTLGTFGGYFRNRDRPMSSTYAYNRYLRHYVLGIIYTRIADIDERQVYSVDSLSQIPSVARDFQFFLHEKYRIASDVPGSGNTKNIGSTKYLERLMNGAGVFANLGVEIFDDYWMHYRTKEMARTEGFTQPPYTNLITYRAYKSQGARILTLPEDAIQSDDSSRSTEDADN